MSNKKKPQQPAAGARGRGTALVQQQKAQEKRRNALIQAGIAAAAVVAVLLVTLAVLDARSVTQAEVVPDGVTEDGGVLVGSADAPTTVTVFEDMQCPFCQTFEARNGPLLTELADGGDVNVEYRILSFLDSAPTDDYSSRAANASACVIGEGTEVWKAFHTSIYQQQPPETGPGLTDEQVTAIAVEAGADEDAVGGCIAEGRYGDWVQQVTEESTDAGVRGTPTVHVDGEQVEADTPEALRAAVAEAQS